MFTILGKQPPPIAVPTHFRAGLGELRVLRKFTPYLVSPSTNLCPRIRGDCMDPDSQERQFSGYSAIYIQLYHSSVAHFTTGKLAGHNGL